MPQKLLALLLVSLALPSGAIAETTPSPLPAVELLPSADAWPSVRLGPLEFPRGSGEPARGLGLRPSGRRFSLLSPYVGLGLSFAPDEGEGPGTLPPTPWLGAGAEVRLGGGASLDLGLTSDVGSGDGTREGPRAGVQLNLRW